MIPAFLEVIAYMLFACAGLATIVRWFGANLPPVTDLLIWAIALELFASRMVKIK